MRQIETGADAGQQHPSRCGGQCVQAAFARGLCGTAQHRVVERSDQRVGVLQAQCRARGLASTNSGISASKWVPSSATIWYVPFMVPIGVVSDEPLVYSQHSPGCRSGSWPTTPRPRTSCTELWASVMIQCRETSCAAISPIFLTVIV